MVEMALERKHNIFNKRLFMGCGIFLIGSKTKEVTRFIFVISQPYNEKTGNEQCERTDGSVNTVIGSGM